MVMSSHRIALTLLERLPLVCMGELCEHRFCNLPPIIHVDISATGWWLFMRYTRHLCPTELRTVVTTLTIPCFSFPQYISQACWKSGSYLFPALLLVGNWNLLMVIILELTEQKMQMQYTAIKSPYIVWYLNPHETARYGEIASAILNFFVCCMEMGLYGWKLKKLWWKHIKLCVIRAMPADGLAP